MTKPKPRKIFVLDTSTLIYDPLSFRSFDYNDVCIPIIVLEELDKCKKLPNESGRNARIAIKNLDALSNQGEISLGIKIENESLVWVDTEDQRGLGSDPEYGDNKLLTGAKKLKAKSKKEVVVVSKDINLRIRAKSLGLGAVDYLKNREVGEDFYTGLKEIKNEDLAAILFSEGELVVEDYKELKNLYPNECVSFFADDGKFICSGRRIKDVLKLTKEKNLWGLSSKNPEQSLAMEMLMDPRIQLITILGKAGCGKTIISLAAGLELILNQRKYETLHIYRPVQPVGNDLGYLPGPQPLEAKILTPMGWTTMGELTINTPIIGRDGKPTLVTGIYPKGIKSVYKLTTTDGTSTECCLDHLWQTITWKEKRYNKYHSLTNEGSVKSTQEILDTLLINGKPNHYLPRIKPVHFEEKNELPLPPYTLGALLGDGSMSDRITLHNMDKELIQRVSDEVSPLGYCLSKRGRLSYRLVSKLSQETNNIHNPGRSIKVVNIKTQNIQYFPSVAVAAREFGVKEITFYKRCRKNTIINDNQFYFNDDNKYHNKIKNIFFELGLLNKICCDKYIPDQYKYSSINSRIDLLRGLMDTDGTIKKSGEASFCTVSKQLALDVIEVVRSLGGRAILRSRPPREHNSIDNFKIVSDRTQYEFTISLPQEINPFYISRKANRHSCSLIQNIGINNIEYVGEKEVQCIMVENADHLYITDNFIVTHNTLSEKLNPHFASVDDNFSQLFPDKSKKKNGWQEQLFQYIDNGTIQKEALTYIRGRSLTNSLIFLDEAQNITREEIKTLITRVGNNSKIILTGDISQIDHPKLDATNNGLSHVVDRFKEYDLSGHITLKVGERSTLSSIAADIL